VLLLNSIFLQQLLGVHVYTHVLILGPPLVISKVQCFKSAECFNIWISYPCRLALLLELLGCRMLYSSDFSLCYELEKQRRKIFSANLTFGGIMKPYLPMDRFSPWDLHYLSHFTEYRLFICPVSIALFKLLVTIFLNK
jgi:hypothetical protein